MILEPAFKHNNIPVIFSSDNNYALYLGVCIKSLIENSSINNNYDIIIFDGGINEFIKKKITAMKKANISIRFYDISEIIQNYDTSIFQTRLHFTIATYYRFFLPQVCSKYDKILYIDCDTLICKDIAELYKIEIGNNYLGVTRDIQIIFNINNHPQEKTYYKKTLKMKKIENYFQGSCLICNIKEMIKDKLTSKLIERLKEVKTPKYVDQCILNSVCEGKVKFIPQNWNYTWHLPIAYKCYKNFVPVPWQTIYEEARKDPYIIHFTGIGMKPWINPAFEKAEYFWHYARQTPFYEEILYKNLKVNPVQNITQQITKVADMSIIREIKNYSKNRFNYYRCKLLANFTFGKMRKHYKDKKKRLKAKIKEVRRFLKGK